jgi:hypothetical protein
LRAFLGQGRQLGHAGLGRGAALGLGASAGCAFIASFAQGAMFLLQALMQQALGLEAPAQRHRDQGQDTGNCQHKKHSGHDLVLHHLSRRHA